MAKNKRDKSKSNATNATSKESLYPPIDQAQKEWLLQKFAEEFNGRVGKQGKVKNSAMEYVQEVIIKQFYKLWYPNSTSSQREEMLAYYEDKIYHALNNRRRRSKANCRHQGGRVVVTSVWVNANPEIKAKLLSDYCQKEGLDATARIGVDVQRKLVCNAFRALPDDERKKWEDAADEARATNSKNKALQGEERLLFSQRFPTLLSQFIQDAQEKAGVLVVAHVAYEISDVGVMQVASVVSPSVKGYKGTDAHADSVAAWTEWLRESKAKNVMRDHPVEAAYPDWQNENYPLIPAIDEENLPPLPIICKIVRVATGAIWQRLGGSQSPPWKEISRSQAKGEHTFVDECRQPPDYPLVDPSIMNKDYGLVWVRWLARTQKNSGDPSTWFTFKLVYTSSLTSKTVRSDATKRTKVQRGSNEVWRLEYDGWVEKCQMGGKIRYPQESLDYVDALKRRAGAVSRSGNSQILCLPCQPNYEATRVIDAETRKYVTDVAEKLPSEEKEEIARLLDALNEMYAHLPAETKDGLWCQDDGSLLKVVGLPSALPASNSSLPTPLAFLKSPLPVEYFLPPSKASTVSRFIFLEEWQERVLQEGFLKHPESKTLLGGECGTLWLVLVLLKALLNVGFVIGKLESGAPLPAEVDKRRFSSSDWEMMLDWCKEWRAAIEATIGILKESFDERTRGEDDCNGNPRSSESKLDWQALESSQSPPASPSTSQLPRPRPRPRPRPATYALERLPDIDDDRSSAGTDSDADASDNFQPVEGGSDNTDSEDEGERSGGGDSGTNRRKGKGVAPGERGPISKPQVTKMEALRERYELSHGATGSELPRSPLGDVQLKSHPLGTILTPNRSEPWEGELEELPNACSVVIKEASAALKAVYESSHQSYSPDDKSQAQQDAELADVPPTYRPYLAVIYRQRIVWNRAKDTWPTIQYQLRLFLELMIKLTNFVLIVDSSVSSASGELADDLKKFSRHVTRIAYRVRFVYQELNDLGVVSKDYYGRMVNGWEGPWYASSLSELKDNVSVILEWSEKAAEVLKYHEESRQRTWEHHRDMTKGRAVPESVRFRFGNPCLLEDAADIRKLLQEGTEIADGLSKLTDASIVLGIQYSDSISEGDGCGDPGTKSPAANDVTADAPPCPEEDMEQGSSEARPDNVVKSTEPADMVAVVTEQGGAAPSGDGNLVLGGGAAAARPNWPTNTKRKSNPIEGNQTSGTSSKKPKVTVVVELGQGKNNGAGATTRAGRVVKVSERARNQG